MTDLSAIAASVLDHTNGQGEEIEAYAVHRVSTTIQVDTDGAVRHISRAEVRGVGVRVICNQRMGYASTADLDEAMISLTVKRARANAAASDPDVAQLLPEPHTADSVDGLLDPRLEQATQSEKLALVVDLARRVVALDPRVSALNTAEYHDEQKTVAVASTRGINVEERSGYVELWSDALGEDRHGRSTDDAFQVVRSPTDCQPELIASKAVERTVNLLGPRVKAPRHIPVILDPAVVAELLAAVGKGLSGGALSSGRSPFAGKNGTTIAPSWLTLVDDGLSPHRSSASTFDDEGVPRRRTALVEAGVLVGELHSTVSASAMGSPASATGNARRSSHKTVPKAAPNCLVLTPTRSLHDIVTTPGQALYVQQLSGAGAGINSVTGRIDVGGVGWLLEDGQNVGPVATVPMSTTLLAFLGSIQVVGDDTYEVPPTPTAASTIMCSSELLHRS